MHHHHEYHVDHLLPIPEETLHGTPGWGKKLVENQHALGETVQALEHRVYQLEQQVKILLAARDGDARP